MPFQRIASQVGLPKLDHMRTGPLCWSNTGWQRLHDWPWMNGVGESVPQVAQAAPPCGVGECPLANTHPLPPVRLSPSRVASQPHATKPTAYFLRSTSSHLRIAVTTSPHLRELIGFNRNPCTIASTLAAHIALGCLCNSVHVSPPAFEAGVLKKHAVPLVHTVLY